VGSSAVHIPASAREMPHLYTSSLPPDHLYQGAISGERSALAKENPDHVVGGKETATGLVPEMFIPENFRELSGFVEPSGFY
jgi:hypothetical protein